MTVEYIPKIVHYAWFGRGKKNKLAKKCIESWKKHLTDYEFIEWNEDNFDLDMYKYTREAYDAKKYAYVTDVVRLHVLYKYGGIYMDTDVEVLKSFGSLMENNAFSGFESNETIPTGLIASEMKNGWIRDQLKIYDALNFLDKNGKPILVTNVQLITKISKEKHNFKPNGEKQILKYGMVMFPKDYFCAKSPDTGEIKCTENTYTIHHFAGSWVNPKNKFNKLIYRVIIAILGRGFAEALRKTKRGFFGDEI